MVKRARHFKTGDKVRVTSRQYNGICTIAKVNRYWVWVLPDSGAPQDMVRITRAAPCEPAPTNDPEEGGDGQW